MPQFIAEQSQQENQSQINYSQDEIAAAMTLIDLSASPRSIAKRMLAEDLVQHGLQMPQSNDSQQAQEAQAKVASNLVQHIKRKREALAVQQQIVQRQILQQTMLVERLSSNEMDTSENGTIPPPPTIPTTTGNQTTMPTTGSFQQQVANQFLFRQNSQLTTNTEEINVDEDDDEDDVVTGINNNNSLNNNQLNANQAQLLLARIQQQQHKPEELQSKIARLVGSGSSQPTVQETTDEAVPQSEVKEVITEVAPTRELISNSVTLPTNSPTILNTASNQVQMLNLVRQVATPQQAIITSAKPQTSSSLNPGSSQQQPQQAQVLPKFILPNTFKTGQLTVKQNQLLPHSAPGVSTILNSAPAGPTNPINIGSKFILNSPNPPQTNNAIVGDSLLTNSCLSGSPILTTATTNTINTSGASPNKVQMITQQHQILQLLQKHHQNNSTSSRDTSAHGTLANTPITTPGGVIINQLISKNRQTIQGGSIPKSLPCFSQQPGKISSPVFSQNGQILNPIMSTGGTNFMARQLPSGGGPMETQPRRRTTSTGGTRKRGDSKKNAERSTE